MGEGVEAQPDEGGGGSLAGDGQGEALPEFTDRVEGSAVAGVHPVEKGIEEEDSDDGKIGQLESE